MSKWSWKIIKVEPRGFNIIPTSEFTLPLVEGVSFATRQMGNMVKPNLVISVGDGGVISLKSESTFKTTEIKFKLDEEFDETTADGRNTKVGPLIIRRRFLMC